MQTMNLNKDDFEEREKARRKEREEKLNNEITHVARILLMMKYNILISTLNQY